MLTAPAPAPLMTSMVPDLLELVTPFLLLSIYTYSSVCIGRESGGSVCEREREMAEDLKGEGESLRGEMTKLFIEIFFFYVC